MAATSMQSFMVSSWASRSSSTVSRKNSPSVTRHFNRGTNAKLFMLTDHAKTYRNSTVATFAGRSKEAPPSLSELAKMVELKPNIKARMNYIKRPSPGEQLRVHFGAAPEGSPPMNFVEDSHEVEIQNMRLLAERPTIDSIGFELINYGPDPSICDFEKDDQIVERIYPAISEAVKHATGASHVVTFYHLVRKRPQDVEHGKLNRQNKYNVERVEPSPRVHCDFTELLAMARLREAFGDNGSKPPSYRRGAVINAWMTINGPTLDAPIALSTPQSVGPNDWVRMEVHPADPEQPVKYETYYFTYNPAHKWYYAPNMGPGELLLFKNYDTDLALPQFTPHAAFFHPDTPPDIEPRMSLECRMALAWY